MRIKLFLLVIVVSLQINGQCWKSVFAADGQTFAIKEDNTLWACGVNDYGELGDGTILTRCSMIQIGSDDNWKFVSGGFAHTVALKTDGTLWAWGDNSNGQLGDGTTIDRHVPIQIGNSNDWKEIAAGGKLTLAIKNNGSLWAWGDNSNGQVGDGSTIDRYFPTQIGNDTDWKNIAAGFYHALATKTNGTLWNWGSVPTLDIFTQPTLIDNATDWDKVSAGYLNSFCIKSDGTLWGWGLNNHGRLGVGSFEDRMIPTQIGNLNNWNKVLPLINSTVAIATDGSLYVWGEDVISFEMSPETTGDYTIPTPIAINQNWSQIASGYFHVMGIKEDHTLWSWGANNYCQLGDGETSAQRDLPFQLECTDLGNAFFLNKDFTIFPNPAKEYLSVLAKENESINSIIISDVTGKKVIENWNEQIIDIQHLRQGIYEIRISSGRKIHIGKFIKE